MSGLTPQEAADLLGVSTRTLLRWEEQGKITPRRTEGGHRRYDIYDLLGNKSDAALTVGYARVSSYDQKKDLERQSQVLEAYCAKQGWSFEIIQDLGSGMNYKKRGLIRLIKLITSYQVERLVLTHKDRLLRFGSELVFCWCEHFGTEVIIINRSEDSSFEEDLAQDVLEIITVFSARLYGSRSHRNKKIVEQLREVALITEMTSATYQTRVPSDLIPYCEAMGFLFGEVERHLYKALEQGEKLNTLKKEYQIRFGINARQFNSVHSSIKGKIESLKECHKRHIKELAERIKELEKTIKKLTKRLRSIRPACGLKGKSPRKLTEWKLHQKKRKLALLQHKLGKIKTNKPSLIFGGKKLWKSQFNLEANGYESHEQWLNDWHDARSSQFMLVGSKDETNGCQNCQLTTDGRLKIRVAPGWEHLFGKHLVTEGIHFNYGQEDIDYALEKGQALTYRFVHKQGQWYIFCTTQRPDVKIQSRYSNGILGVDLNPGLIGWAVCDKEGNLKDKGQIRLNLNDRSTEQIEATLGDAVKQLVDIAADYGCAIAVEQLDFSNKKTSMKEQGVRYSRMLSNFSYAKFLEILSSRTQRFGIELIELNPAYSSFIGLLKFMPMYGLSSDTAAAFVLARRAIGKSERVPANLARFLPEDRFRHSWSFWNWLKKKFDVIKRHDFFDFNAANSGMVVTLVDESVPHGTGRLTGKRSRASIDR